VAPEHIAIWDGDGSLSTGGERVWSYEGVLRGAGEARGTEHFDYDEVESNFAGLDLLKRIAEKSALFINITVSTTRSDWRDCSNREAPHPALRLDAVKQLREAGISTGVFASPLLPGITDREGDLEAVEKRRMRRGPQWFTSGVLFLTPSSSKVLCLFCRRSFPGLWRNTGSGTRGIRMRPKSIGEDSGEGSAIAAEVWIRCAAMGRDETAGVAGGAAEAGLSVS